MNWISLLLELERQHLKIKIDKLDFVNGFKFYKGTIDGHLLSISSKEIYVHYEIS